MTKTKKLSIELVERWYSNNGKGYFFYHNLIQDALMEIGAIGEAPSFFDEIDKALATKMNLGNRSGNSYKDFMSALNDLRSAWVH